MTAGIKKSTIALGLSLFATSASAATIFVPCDDYQIPAPVSALSHVHRVTHHRAVHHRFRHHRAHRRAKGHRGSRMALLHRMCPVWADDSLGGPAGFSPASGGWFDRTAYTDSGASFGDASFGGLGAGAGDGEGWAGGASSVQPATYIVQNIDNTSTTVLTTVVNTTTTIINGKPCWRPTPVPEPATWLLMLLGFASMMILGRRFAPCVASR